MSQQAQPPPLVYYSSENEYFNYFCRMYCDLNNPIYTFDRIKVDFDSQCFKDAFHESSNRAKKDKSIFSRERAERIDWIKWALNQNSPLFQGWISKKKCYDSRRRVCIVNTNYIVVIRVRQNHKAFFITAYVVNDPVKLQLILGSPRWVP